MPHKQSAHTRSASPGRAQKDAAELESLLAHAPIGYALFDRAGRLVRVNRRFAAMTGLPAESHAGLLVADVLPVNAHEIDTIVEQVFRTGVPVAEREIIGRPPAQPGAARSWLASFHPVPGDGDVAGVGATIVETTAPKAAEQALRTTDQRLRLALQAGRMGSWEWDIPTGRVVWSPELEEVHGLSPGQFAGTIQAVRAEMHPDDRDRVAAAVADAIERDAEYRVQYRILPPDGAERWLEAHGAVVRDEAGRPVRMVGICADITRRKLADEALRDSEERFRATFQDAPVGIAHVDLSGRFLLFNPRFAEITGRSPAELASLTFRQITHPDDIEPDASQARRLFAGQIESYTLEKRYLKPGGVLVWVNLTRSLLRDAQGRPKLAITVIEDITERRRDREAARFLAEASTVLASSLDPRTTLGAVARLAVPNLADWCAVHAVGPDGALQLLAVAHTDPAKVRLAHELDRRYPPRPDAPAGAPRVARTGEPEVLADIPDDLLKAAARDDEHLRILKELGLRSYICVPVQARGRTFGVITFISGQPGHRYSRPELEMAQELARRAATAFDNATLYAGAQQELAERTRAEEALRESQEKLRLALRASSMGSWTRDFATGRVEWSSELEEICGLPAGSFPGTEEAFFDIVHPDDREHVRAAIADAVANGAEYEVEFRFTRAPGELRWMVGRGRAFYDDAGAPVRLAGVGIDVTARKELELARRESEGLLQAVVQTAVDGIITIDAAGVVRTVNPAAERIFGYAASEMIGRNVSMLMPTPHREQHDEYLANYHRTGERKIIGIGREVQGRRRDGSVFPIELSVSELRLGDALVFTGIVRDITERKRAEQHLRESEARKSAILESALDTIITIDHEDRILEFNPAAERTFGHRREDVIGRKLAQVVIPERYREAHDRGMARFLAQGQGPVIGRRVEMPALRASGEEFPCELAISVIRIPDQPPLFTAQLRDITDRRRAEQALRDETIALETLNDTGKALAAELDPDKLIQAITDAGTKLTGAAFGAFFYNVVDQRGESYTLYALSGAPREAFARFPMPRNTAVFSPTFRGEGVLRSDDITKDPRYGRNKPYAGLPEGHLPVRSYLAVPVTSRSGEVLGGLFFGHTAPGAFSERVERIAVGLASQAAIAIDNARLYQNVQRELAERTRAQDDLRRTAERLSVALAAARLGDWAWQLDTDLVTFSDRACEMLGLPEGARITWADLQRRLHEDDRAATVAAVERALADRTDYDVEYRVRHDDGSLRWIAARGRPLYDHAGAPAGMIGVVLDVTDRKLAEEARARLATIVESSDDAITSKTIDGVITTWNRGAERLFGYSAAEAIGRPLAIIIPPERIAEEAEILRKIRRGERIEHYETVRRAKDGRTLDVSVAISPIYDAAGAVVGASKIARDITARKRDEARTLFLLRLDDAVRPLTDPDLIIAAAARLLGEHLGVNRCAYAEVDDDQDTFNLTGDYNNGVPSIVGRYRLAQFGGEVPRLMRAGEPYAVEDAESDPRTADVRPAYRQTDIRALICVPLLKAGRLVSAMAVHQTTPRRWRPDEIELVQHVAGRCWESIERARVARGLRQSEEQFRRAIQEAPVPVIMHADDGQVLQVSRAWTILTGYAPEDIPTVEAWMRHAHGSGAERIRESVRRLFDGDAGLEKTEFEIITRSGRRRYWDFSASAPGTLADGRRFIVGMAVDITDRKLAEDALRDLSGRLELRVHERTAQLEESNRELEAFSYSVSHDLRAPLRHIAGFADLLRRRAAAALDETSQRYISTISDAAGHAGQLVDDLLSFSRMARTEMRNSPVDLAALAAEVRRDLARETDDRALRWEIGELPEVRGDPAMLRLVLRNLMANAVKYSRGRDPAVIRLTASRADGETVVAVQDNGVGFDMKYVDKLFGVFQRLHSQQEFEGTGIGLALVRRIISRHGGRTWAQAEPGSGATFFFSLPDHSPDVNHHTGGDGAL